MRMRSEATPSKAVHGRREPTGDLAPRRALIAAICVTLVVAALFAGAASAATPAPGWTIDGFPTPTHFSEGDNARCLQGLENGNTETCDAYEISVADAGSVASDGSAITLDDLLPAGLKVQKVAFFWSGFSPPETDLGGFLCSTSAAGGGTEVQCQLNTNEFGLPPVAPDDTLKVFIYVTVEGASGALASNASVAGGGGGQASIPVTNEVSSSPPPFEASAFSVLIAGADGAADTQAGGHPYELTTTIDLANSIRRSATSALQATAVQDVKDVVVDLPLGFVGSAVATPRCTLTQLSSSTGCPAATQVGHLTTEPINGSTQIDGPIYNLVPEHGVVAEFGFVDVLKTSHVLYARVVPTPAGYVLRTVAHNVPQAPLTRIVATFFGVPATKTGSGDASVAMFTNPADCSGAPLVTTLYMDSWQNPGRSDSEGNPDLSDPSWTKASSSAPSGTSPVTGCNLLQFNPTLSVQPDSSVADSPSGLDLELRVPQSEDPGTLATPPLKTAVVTLPPGLTVDPSAANGLGACSLAQIGLGSANEPTCPDSSRIGTVEVLTPLLPNPLGGSIYLANQDENPFGSVLAAYIVIDDPVTGIVIKVPGKLELSAAGQVTATFDDSPQLPFGDLKLHFFGGTRGDLATPESCGTFTMTSALSPWSAPDSGPSAEPSSSFTIGSGCVSSFSPRFSAGTTSSQAGAYSPFTLSLSRADDEQEIAGVSVSLPSGLLAKIAGVPRCTDAELASAASRSGTAEQSSPSCPPASQVGVVQALAGPGPTPFVATGKAYLTGPYRGQPFGLAVVVPVLAGPFDLGTEVVRQALQIDPSDGHVTVLSDPLPTVLHAVGPDGHDNGFPARLRRIDVTVDRPGFTFNPTSCEPKTIAGAASSAGGLSASLSSRFQAAGCASLPFKPSLSASTQGRTSKANGASLTVKVTQRSGQANIRKVVLALPIQLPSRLTTLQKACTATQFDANPDRCPEAAFVGTAIAHTPLLDVPLAGPAILVSHGGAAFPDVEFVLQGEGVKIVLDGKTDIKKGITYSRFETVPDAPISSFETVLPEGPHSALAANGNLCASTKTVTVKRRVIRRIHGRLEHVLATVKRLVTQRLSMPTTIVGQNGATVKQLTKITTTGCGRKAHPKRHRHKHSRRTARRR
jgi:hypothetical protein